MTAWTTQGYNLTGAGDPERLRGAQVSANFFRFLGVAPVAGRDFTDNEDQPGAQRSRELTGTERKVHINSYRNATRFEF